MSKPIVVIWQNGVNLFQDNTKIAVKGAVNHYLSPYLTVIQQ